MTTDFDLIFIAVLSGGILGLMYFGLLWASVHLLPRHRGPLIFVGLALARAALMTAALAAGLMFGVPPTAVAAALAGFVGVRLLATRAVGPKIGGAPWK